MNRFLATASSIVLLLGTSGCAVMHENFGRAAPVVCAVIGGVVGAGAGAALRYSKHSGYEHDEYNRGVAIGAGAGAVAGGLLCALGDSDKASAPSVRATANPSSGTLPLTVDFRCLAESSAGIDSYAWDFGDGTSASTQNANHSYAKAGNYSARCSAKASDGQLGSATAPVAVAAAAAGGCGRVVLRGLRFQFDRASLDMLEGMSRAEAEAILDVAVEKLQEPACSGLRMQVAGHTDGVGAEAYNQRLSEQRASAVLDYLVSQGIAAARLSAIGYGESKPVADNASADGRSQNRRVELSQL